MAERLINVDRDTPMLLPPDLRDWVADNELARLILEAVELCDLQGAQRNLRGAGSARYPPTMVLALLIYCYASGAGVASVVAEAGQPAVALVDKGYEHSELIERVEEAYQMMILCPLRQRPHTQENPRQRRGQRRHVFELRQRMKARLSQPALQALYRRRAVTVEPVFARIKRHMGFTRLRCWGHRAASAEWTLVGLAVTSNFSAGGRISAPPAAKTNPSVMPYSHLSSSSKPDSL